MLTLSVDNQSIDAKTCIVCMQEENDVQNYSSFYQCECKICNFHPKCFGEYSSKFGICPICRKGVEFSHQVHIEIVNIEGNNVLNARVRNDCKICLFISYRTFIMVNLLVFMIFSDILSRLILLFSGVDLAYNLYETLMSNIVRSYSIPVRYNTTSRLVWSMISIARIFIVIISLLTLSPDIFPIYYYCFNCVYMCIEGCYVILVYRIREG